MILRCYGDTKLSSLINKNLYECAWTKSLSKTIEKKFTTVENTKFCIFRITFPEGPGNITRAYFDLLATGSSPTPANELESDLKFQYESLSLREDELILYYGEISGEESLKNLGLIYQCIREGELSIAENLNKQIHSN